MLSEAKHLLHKLQIPSCESHLHGLVLQSTAGNLDLELKCIGNGELKIWLRGIDCKDKNGKRFPVWIDFTNFAVDGNTIFENSHLVWHDKPFVHSFKVSDGQVIKIHAEWKPFDKNSVIE